MWIILVYNITIRDNEINRISSIQELDSRWLWTVTRTKEPTSRRNEQKFSNINRIHQMQKWKVIFCEIYINSTEINTKQRSSEINLNVHDVD